MGKIVMPDHSVVTSRKLSSYSAAAAVGAFVSPAAMDAEIIYTDLSPDVDVQLGVTPEINLDNSADGYFEVAFITTGGNIQVRDAYSGNVLTTGGTYYVKGFTEGDEIGPGAAEASDGGAHVAGTTGNYNFFSGDDKYIGVAFEIAGQVHYGWIGFEIDSTNPLHGIIRDYAYESVANTAITAGEKPVPEPGSLALLAAGAGAMALRRRKCA